MRYCVQLLTLLFFSASMSCATQDSNTLEQTKEVISFDLKFRPRPIFHGVLEEKQENIYYFSDVVSYKEVVFFNSKYEKIKTISLKEVAKEDNIGGIKPINSDSILVLSLHTSNIYLVNQNGKILKKIILKSLIDVPIEVNAPIAFIDGDVNSLLLANSPPLDSNFNSSDMINSMKLSWNESNKRGYLIKVENALKDPKLSFCVKGFYSNFAKDDYLYTESPHYLSLKNNIFILSCYSDSLYISERNSCTVEKKIPVKSKFTQLPTEAVSINKDNVANSTHNVHLQTFGYVHDICYDEYRNVYYLSIVHKVPINATKEERGGSRAWSVLVLNEKFEALDEVKFEPKQFNHGFIIPVKKGILISNYKDRDSDDISTKFTLFKVNL